MHSWIACLPHEIKAHILSLFDDVTFGIKIAKWLAIDDPFLLLRRTREWKWEDENALAPTELAQIMHWLMTMKLRAKERNAEIDVSVLPFSRYEGTMISLPESTLQRIVRVMYRHRDASRWNWFLPLLFASDYLLEMIPLSYFPPRDQAGPGQVFRAVTDRWFVRVESTDAEADWERAWSVVKDPACRNARHLSPYILTRLVNNCVPWAPRDLRPFALRVLNDDFFDPYLAAMPFSDVIEALCRMVSMSGYFWDDVEQIVARDIFSYAPDYCVVPLRRIVHLHFSNLQVWCLRSPYQIPIRMRRSLGVFLAWLFAQYEKSDGTKTPEDFFALEKDEVGGWTFQEKDSVWWTGKSESAGEKEMGQRLIDWLFFFCNNTPLPPCHFY